MAGTGCAGTRLALTAAGQWHLRPESDRLLGAFIETFRFLAGRVRALETSPAKDVEAGAANGEVGMLLVSSGVAPEQCAGRGHPCCARSVRSSSTSRSCGTASRARPKTAGCGPPGSLASREPGRLVIGAEPSVSRRRAADGARLQLVADGGYAGQRLYKPLLRRSAAGGYNLAYMNEANGGNGAQGPDPGSGGSGNWASPGSSGQPGRSSGSGGWGGFGGKRLERKLEGRWIAGVCAGLADYLGVDPNLVRVVLAVLVIFGGFGALVYVLAWALVPEEGESASVAEKIINKNGMSGGQG
jgi:phage shock protein PspC (stress-responsive transcriptional regulator)